MESQRLREQVKEVSSPATRHVQAPFDAPVHDFVTGTMIRPSEMQSNVLDRVIPSVLPSIQSVAEDVLNDHFGNSSKISSRIEDATTSGVIDRQLASKAHYWRITRNVLAHGGGIISPRVEREVRDLLAANKVLFNQFLFWGPLLDAGHRDIPDAVHVPIIDAAVGNPANPGTQCQPIAIVAGNKIQIGLADLLAASEVWATVIHTVSGR